MLLLARTARALRAPLARRARAPARGAATAEPDVTAAYDELRATRVAKADAMRAAGVEPFAYAFSATHSAAEAQAQWAALENGKEAEGERLAVRGRVVAKRVFGKKLAFLGLRDATGEIQLFLEKKRLNANEDAAKTFKNLVDWVDAGDIVGARGTAKRTEKGELSVYVDDWEMLTKALAPLPDKFRGLTDVQTRYRKRELDLIANPDVRRTFELRARATSRIRRFLDDRGFLELETPTLHSQPGGAEAKPFETKHAALGLDLTLRIATELHLKRLVVGGFDRVYELGRIFRNEGVSTRHNPEFTSVEVYEAYADYESMMELTESLVEGLATELVGSTTLPYGDETIDVARPWPPRACPRRSAPRAGPSASCSTSASRSSARARCGSRRSSSTTPSRSRRSRSRTGPSRASSSASSSSSWAASSRTPSRSSRTPWTSARASRPRPRRRPPATRRRAASTRTSSARSSTACRRPPAWASASTASSCSSRTRRRSATSSPSRSSSRTRETT